mgnify:CR=1 FL=1
MRGRNPEPVLDSAPEEVVDRKIEVTVGISAPVSHAIAEEISLALRPALLSTFPGSTIRALWVHEVRRCGHGG